MENNHCKICGFELFSLNNDELWCPVCEGIHPLEKEDSLRLCKDLLIELDNEINTYCEHFSFDHLLELAYQFREFKTRSFNPPNVSWSILEIVTANLLINKVLSGHHGEISKKNYKFSIPFLMQSISDFIHLKNSKILIREGYGNLFNYSQVKNRIEEGQIYSSELNEYYVFIPHRSWRTFFKNLENEANLANRDKLVKMSDKLPRNFDVSYIRKKIKKTQINQNMIRLVEMMYNSFHFIYHDAEMFEFNEIDITKETLIFFSELTNIALERLPMLNKTSIVRISTDEFFEIANKYKYDSYKLFEMFVSTTNSIKDFPILIEHKRTIILSPETMFLLNGVFEYRLNKKKYDSLISGDIFEYEVEMELNKIGFRTDDPINKGKFLRNRKIKYNDINGNSKNREIDLLAYDDSVLLVVECKEWRPKPKMLRKYEQNYKVKDIKKEIEEKHLDRVNYIQNNKQKFGFAQNLKVIGILVTRIKENIEEYEGIRIIPKYELKKNKLF